MLLLPGGMQGQQEIAGVKLGKADMALGPSSSMRLHQEGRAFVVHCTDWKAGSSLMWGCRDSQKLAWGST